MGKVIGVGGVFFRAKDRDSLWSWYKQNLGLESGPGGAVLFPWRLADDPGQEGMTVWSLFPDETEYFGPTKPAFMINYIVDDLDGLLESLRAQGANVDDRREEHEYGRFAWVTDPEGNRIELWEPPRKGPSSS